MSTVTFDTLKFAEALDTSLATKNDIFSVRQDISDVKSELKLMKWMLGVLIGGIVFILLRLYFPMP